MNKPSKNRTTATFSIDTKLLELLKFSSELECKPMSRIVDVAIQNYLKNSHKDLFQDWVDSKRKHQQILTTERAG